MTFAIAVLTGVGFGLGLSLWNWGAALAFQVARSVVKDIRAMSE